MEVFTFKVVVPHYSNNNDVVKLVAITALPKQEGLTNSLQAH